MIALSANSSFSTVAGGVSPATGLAAFSGNAAAVVELRPQAVSLALCPRLPSLQQLRCERAGFQLRRPREPD